MTRTQSDLAEIQELAFLKDFCPDPYWATDENGLDYYAEDENENQFFDVAEYMKCREAEFGNNLTTLDPYAPKSESLSTLRCSLIVLVPPMLPVEPMRGTTVTVLFPTPRSPWSTLAASPVCRTTATMITTRSNTTTLKPPRCVI